MVHSIRLRPFTRVSIVLALVAASVLPAQEAESRRYSRRQLVGCGAALLLSGVAVGAWLFSPTLFRGEPIELRSDEEPSPVADAPGGHYGAEFRELLDRRGGSIRLELTDGASQPPVLRLFHKNRLHRVVADKIKAAIQKRNPNVDGAEIGVGEEGMAIRVSYFELILQPDGLVRLAVGASSWRLESTRSYAPEQLLDGGTHQIDFGPHVELDDNGMASFRSGLLLRFDAKRTVFRIPHAKLTIRLEARPFFHAEDSAEVHDIVTSEVR
jgi:hypothetical protein